MAKPPRTTVEKKGPGRQARPISSTSTVRSRRFIPLPPYFSGITSPIQPPVELNHFVSVRLEPENHGLLGSMTRTSINAGKDLQALFPIPVDVVRGELLSHKGQSDDVTFRVEQDTTLQRIRVQLLQDDGDFWRNSADYVIIIKVQKLSIALPS